MIHVRRLATSVRTPSARRDLLVLLAILALAAVTRLPGLDARGQWDADQGNEMLVLLHLARDGTVPLLGPPTFAGTFHHGALYYYLLTPAALLGDADPRAVTLELALLGILTVAATWGLGRALAGAWAGHVAGLLAAVSPAAVLGSTTIWNPNIVPLGSVIALLGAIAAWRTRLAAWWLAAAGGAMFAMQAHVSGGILLPPLLLAFALDVLRGPAGTRRPVLLAGVAGAGILALGYLPLLEHELGTGFSDTRGLLGYLGGGAGSGGATPDRMLVVALRSTGWPFVGVITEAPMLAALVALAAIGLGAAAIRWAPRGGRCGAWLLLGVFAWSLPALALTAPTLTTSIPGLPNDHYHAFLDPLVIALTGAGIAALGRARVPFRAGRTANGEPAAPADGEPAAPGRAGTSTIPGRSAALVALVALVAICVVRWPPAASPDGSWSLADVAAARVLGADAVRPGFALVSIPDAKAPDALRFPLERRGVVPLQAAAVDADGDGGVGPSAIVVVCDPLFDELNGAPCGGPVEDAWLASVSRLGWRLVDRFAAGPRRIVSVYARDAP